MEDIKSQSFIAFYEEHVDALYRFIFFKISNKEEAWDITQESFMKIWNYSKNEKNAIKNKKAFLFTIARNAIIDHWRHKGKHPTSDIEDIAFTLEDGNNLHDQTVLQDDIRNIQKLLHRIPEHQREIITLRYVDDLPFRDIAKITGKNIIAVRVEAHRAIKKLKALSAKPHTT